MVSYIQCNYVVKTKDSNMISAKQRFNKKVYTSDSQEIQFESHLNGTCEPFGTQQDGTGIIVDARQAYTVIV